LSDDSSALREIAAKLDQLAQRSGEQSHWLWQSCQLLLASQQATSLLLEDFLPATNPRYRDPLRLCATPGQVFSQHNEDAIIAEIFRRIGIEHRTFLEIGAGDGSENTSRLLLELGWSGTWVEGAPEAAATIRANFAGPIGQGRLTFQEALLTAETVDEVVASVDGDTLDYLAMDIDQNTYHIWKALDRLRPRVVCIEYNASFPASVDWVAPYDPAKLWDGRNRFGASLKAMERLGEEKGYALVGCDLRGVNAFFVRKDQDLALFAAPFTAENHYEPPRYPMAGTAHRGHPS